MGTILFFVILVLTLSGLNAYHTVAPNAAVEEDYAIDLYKSIPKDFNFGFEDNAVTNQFIEVEFNSNDVAFDSSEVTTSSSDSQPLESWSVVWYIASFGGLITFFLVVSCSEWCCRRNARRNCQTNSTNQNNATIPDTPPPSYDHFAPPSYESLSCNKNGEKTQFEVYVVPVDAFGPIMSQNSRLDDNPPSYISASRGNPKEGISRVPVHTPSIRKEENNKDSNVQPSGT